MSEYDFVYQDGTREAVSRAGVAKLEKRLERARRSVDRAMRAARRARAGDAAVRASDELAAALREEHEACETLRLCID